MNLKFDGQFVLLVAKLTKEYFAYFFDLILNFLLTTSYNLDFHKVHEGGSRRIHQVIKTAGNSSKVDAPL